jgi:DNA-binding transcriptional LysR family regulator
LVVLSAPGPASLDDLISTGNVRLAVLRTGCSYRQKLEALLARRGVATPRVMQFGTLETIFACVAAGLGITLLPRSLLHTSRFAQQVAAIALPSPEANVETVFVSRREAAPSSALAAFLAFAEQVFQRLPASISTA